MLQGSLCTLCRHLSNDVPSSKGYFSLLVLPGNLYSLINEYLNINTISYHSGPCIWLTRTNKSKHNTNRRRIFCTSLTHKSPSLKPDCCHKYVSTCRLFSFVAADEKEDSILGSILLPSFHISMLSVDDHISRKYAFKVNTSYIF